MKKKLSVFLVTAMALTACFALTACDFNKKAEAETFVSIDINPSIEFTLDKNNKVLSVYGANEDGQVLLYGEEGIVGADIEVATAKVLELAKELGYVNENNTVVQTTVSSDRNGKDEAVYNKINAQVEASAEKLSLSLKCSTETSYSLNRRLEQLKAQYPDSAAIQGLTPSKLKLVISAAENGEITIEAAAEMNNAELIKAISVSHDKAEAFATEAYKQAKAVASSAYDQAVGMAVDGVYTAFYAKSVLQLRHLDSCYLGAMYQSYKMGSRALHAVADGLVFVEKVNEYTIENEEQITAVLQAFGSDVTADDLKNSDGNITLNSIYAYADKTFKNSQAAADLEEIKTKLNAALDTIDAELQAKIAEAAEKYAPQIESITEGIDKIVNALPDSVKEIADTVFADLTDMCNNIAAIMQDGKITSDEVRAIAKQMEVKAGDTLAKIEQDLDEDELAEIESTKQELLKKTASAKKQMEEALTKAEADAKAKLEEIKANRTNK